MLFLKNRLLICIILFSFGIIAHLNAQNWFSERGRTIALLDLTVKNSELDNAELYSATHLLKLAGIPFIISDKVDSVLNYGFILCSSKINNSTFTTQESDSLIAYVDNGGILIAPNVSATSFLNLFGLASSSTSDGMHRMTFDTVLASQECRWINDSAEVTISLGKASYATTINTRVYTEAGGNVIGRYETSASAIVRNAFGSGFTYALGTSFRSMILIPQVNKDSEAQRIYSNGFEPTSDALMFFIKGIYDKFIPNAVWSHTSMGTSKSTLMISHDVDSRTASDSMYAFADYEASKGIKAHYMITVRYISDDWMSDFYDSTCVSNIQYLLGKNQLIGSHSIMHVPDFDNDSIFPLGQRGLNRFTYLPYYTNGNTSGGSVYGETEVSKNVLETDFPIEIKTFRTGYLLYNKMMANALDTLGYQFNSSFSACDVLTNFPFQSRYNLDSHDQLPNNLWELPMTISDVFKTDLISPTNYLQKVDIWLDVLKRARKNNAPTILLIHPNRLWKVQAEMSFIDQLPTAVFISDIESYGNFWKARDAFTFTSLKNADTLIITIPISCFPLHPKLSLIVDNGQDIEKIKVQSSLGNSIVHSSFPWESNSKIITFTNGLPVNESIVQTQSISSSLPDSEQTLRVGCYPNPIVDHIKIEFQLDSSSEVSIKITDLMGKTVKSLGSTWFSAGINVQSFNTSGLLPGIYFCTLTTFNTKVVKKLILRP